MYTMYDTLLQLPLFQGLCHEDFSNILEKVTLHFTKYKIGESVAESKMPCDRLIFLLQGEVSITTTSQDGVYSIVERAKAPFVIEPYALLGMNINYISSYTAYTEISAISISKTLVLNALLKYDIFRLNYMNLISNRAQCLHARLWDEAPHDLTDRLVAFISTHVERLAGEKILKIKMENLAKHLSDTRLNVSKTLNKLQEEGLIQLRRKEIVVGDGERLTVWNEERKQKEKEN